MYKWKIFTSICLLSILALEIICLRDLPDISPKKIYANASSDQSISLSETDNNTLPDRRKTAPEIRKALRKITGEKYEFQIWIIGDIPQGSSKTQVYYPSPDGYREYYDTFDKRITLSSFLVHLHSPPAA